MDMKCSSIVLAAVATAAIAEAWRRLAGVGALPVGNAPRGFATFEQSDITRGARVVKFSGAMPE